ncbi:MAG: sulfotransferase domain-containing protein [Rhizomicrobium sp.]
MTAPAGIVWLASFPKSGNTWFRIFLANLAAGENGPADINNLDERGGIASSRHEFEAATMLDSGLLSHDDIDGLRPHVYERIASEAKEQRWIKVHDAYTALPDGEPMLGRSARAAIYLVRDPRDVAVSLSHHNNTDIDGAIAMMNDSSSAFSRKSKGLPQQLRQKLLGWSGHAASWIDQTDVPVHVVRYEALRADPMTHFSAALAFAERPAAADDIACAIRHADFSELQRQESEKGFAERQSRSAPFFRSGRVGGWQDVLSTEQVARIEEAHAPLMHRLGYSMLGR